MCHSVGNQPYSTRCSARDSAIMALFTFGEGPSVAFCIDGARKAILFNTAPDTVAMIFAAVIAVVSLAAGLALYGRYQHNFADRL